MNAMGFIKGMITGVVVGGTAALMLDPITPRQRKRAKRQAANMVRNVGYMVDSLINVKH